MSHARSRSLLVPREHGAWGIVLIPLITGAVVGIAGGGSPWPILPLTLAALGLFWLRTPAEIWLETAPVHARTPAEIQSVRSAAFVLSGLSGAALVWLLWGGAHPM